ncbi:alkanesulfonate monooxygenase SsuD/methylene tetrahydromethanopterin reductase-like flavin-dependent oxidoreductase (luciferase family) [Crossiella equi]|uniref:Alkanesulfonate monooxygenase SsuD/methylene tetrahydromethanopterin reductase-like flavin-dependent oxidoreductase (Luciferase family) n=1 Tax=Crossiella equi TaxID=130796 RepID=A0ABS5AQG4_9PSEU|nr:alkanesulfonate monooxygenase SsuD/methylene tetrahydromethanopterin reductase-like flavin-dependent oxidoreductase (luciferase family) [Crossiella equi]
MAGTGPVPRRVSGGQVAEVGRYAREVERLGGDSLWVIDRALSPVAPKVGYNGGETFPEQFNAVLDPFALLAAAAGATERVAIGTNILNTPWYPPVLLARADHAGPAQRRPPGPRFRDGLVAG